MNKKKWVICSLIFLLFGATSGMVDAAEFKVALLTPGSISDAGWNALAYEGLKRIEKQLGVEVSHVESKVPSQWEEHFRFYASKGYGLVFGHGFEYQEAAKAVAPDFPDTVFITTSGNTVLDNVASIVFELEEVTYLLGVIAGTMTQTGKIGLIGGMNIPPINSTFHALEEGAKSVNPDIKVSRSYVGDWENLGKAKELALSQLRRGLISSSITRMPLGVGFFMLLKRLAKRVRTFTLSVQIWIRTTLHPMQYLPVPPLIPKPLYTSLSWCRQANLSPG